MTTDSSLPPQLSPAADATTDQQPLPTQTWGPLSRPMRILLVDDSEAIRRLLGAHLERNGAQVIPVTDGHQALATIADYTRQGYGFDVILMDMQLPNLDGRSAVVALRAIGYAGKIFALTANEDAFVQTQALEAGCDAYATKPLTPDQLLRLILENV